MCLIFSTLQQLTGINGIIFYLVLLIGICVFCSFSKFQSRKIYVIIGISVSFLIEWFFGSFIAYTIGTRIFRCAVIIEILIILLNNDLHLSKSTSLLFK